MNRLIAALNADGPWFSRAAWVGVSIAMLFLITGVIWLHATGRIGERFAGDVVFYALALIGSQFGVYTLRKGVAEWGGRRRKAKTEDDK